MIPSPYLSWRTFSPDLYCCLFDFAKVRELVFIFNGDDGGGGPSMEPFEGLKDLYDSCVIEMLEVGLGDAIEAVGAITCVAT